MLFPRRLRCKRHPTFFALKIEKRTISYVLISVFFKTNIKIVAIHFMITWCPTIYSASILSSISEEGKPLESPPRANFDNDILGLCVIICSYKYDCFFQYFFSIWQHKVNVYVFLIMENHSEMYT